MFHATEKVINLVSDCDRLISLVSRPVGNGPHNIVLPLDRFSSPPPVNEQVVAVADRLTLNGFSVEIPTGEFWRSQPDWPHIRAQQERLSEAVPGMERLLISHTPDEGVLNLLGAESPATSLLEGHFVEALIEPAGALMRGLRTSDSDGVMQAAQAMSGLGSGLTPAGDDFLSGAMMACWAGFCAQEMLARLPEIAAAAGERTTRLSAAYLHSAANGQYGEIWHRLLQSICTGEASLWSESLETIVNLGHNSGAYTLAGFIKLAAN